MHLIKFGRREAQTNALHNFYFFSILSINLIEWKFIKFEWITFRFSNHNLWLWFEPNQKKSARSAKGYKSGDEKRKKIDAQIGIKETDKCTVAIPTLALWNA